MKKKKSLIPSKCRNCDTPTISRYCHNCGQDLFAGREKTIKEVIFQLLESIFALDNKTLITLKYLLFFPGKLTNEYFAGRVVRYVKPGKLFWFVSIFFFMALTLQINSSFDSLIKKDIKEQQADSLKGMSPLDLSAISEVQNEVKAGADIKENKTFTIKMASLDKTISSDTNKLKKELSDINNKKENQKTADNNTDKYKGRTRDIFRFFRSFVPTYSPYIVFILIPFFALLLFIFFYNRQSYYARHFIFSVHYHTFLYVYMGILLLINYAGFQQLLVGPVFLIPLVYFLIALHNVYHPTFKEAFWKLPLFGLIYLIFSMIIVGLTLLGIIYFLHQIGSLEEYSFFNFK